MNFDEAFVQYLVRLDNMKTQLKDLTEESTKTALVMPFFAMLGYDIFNASEFMPEYTCDVATKKGEKVDYAILRDGDPIMLIEVKRSGMKLQKQQQGQLFRYFSTNRCRIAILTNGIIYQFFSDLNAPNVMDDEPFLSFNLIEDDPALYSSAVRQFSKEKFNVKNVISKAIFQKYSNVVQKTLKEDLLSPSDELVKYFLSRPEVKTGNRITAQMIEKYREPTQKAMQKVFGITIQENVAPAEVPPPPPPPSVETSPVEISTVIEEPEPVIPDEPIEEKTEEITLESLQKLINDHAKSNIAEFSSQIEENPDILRVHIYTVGNRKFGVVKIQKSDLSIQLRKLINGKPEVYDVKSFDELKDYLHFS